MAWPWEPEFKSAPLDAALYGMAQRLAAEGKLPRDHPAWAQTERDEQRRFIAMTQPELFDQELADILALPLHNSWDSA